MPRPPAGASTATSAAKPAAGSARWCSTRSNRCNRTPRAQGSAEASIAPSTSSTVARPRRASRSAAMPRALADGSRWTIEATRRHRQLLRQHHRGIPRAPACDQHPQRLVAAPGPPAEQVVVDLRPGGSGCRRSGAWPRRADRGPGMAAPHTGRAHGHRLTSPGFIAVLSLEAHDRLSTRPIGPVSASEPSTTARQMQSRSAPAIG